jgi:flagellar hook-basal body complex protein FliE
MISVPITPALVAPGFAPDIPQPASAPDGNASLGASFADAVTSASSALSRADAAEHAFIAGHGGLQEMVLERAQADVILSLAATTASRATQSLATILNMQV